MSDKPRTSFAVVKNNLLLTEYSWNLNTLQKSPITYLQLYFKPISERFFSSEYILWGLSVDGYKETENTWYSKTVEGTFQKHT